MCIFNNSRTIYYRGLRVSIAVIGLLVLSLMIVVHELGHLLAARAVGIQAEEFSLGIGPALLKFPIGGTLYCVRAFPLGGYVRFIEDDGIRDDLKLFDKEKVWKRIFVTVAGPVASISLAVVLFAVSAMTFGVPTRIPEVGEIHENASAEQAGLLPGDRIVQIDDTVLNHAQPDEGVTQIRALLGQNQGEPISLVVEREGEEVDLTITPRFDGELQGYEAGFELADEQQQQNLFVAINYGLVATSLAIVLSLVLIAAPAVVESAGEYANGGAGEYAGGFAGPVGMVERIGGIAMQSGVEQLMFSAAVITVAVGLFNLIPFPPLDGGRLALLFLEGIRRKPLNPMIEISMQVVGGLLLLGFVVWVTIGDIRRLF